MKNKVSKTRFVSIVRLFALAVLSISSALYCINLAFAIQQSTITISGTTGNITVTNNQINNLTIKPTLIFNKTNDSITYQIPLSNPSGNEFEIKSVTDDNSNQYITTSYTFDKGLNANEKSIYATLTYANYLPFGENLNLNDIHIKISLEEFEPKTTVVPNTGQNTVTTPTIQTLSQAPALIPVIIASLTITIITFLPKRHKIKFGTLTVLTLAFTFNNLLPSFSHAKTSDLTITISSSNIKATPDTTNPKNVVTVKFPNIYNNSLMSKTFDNGNAIILKTLDDKYVLMDTGNSYTDIKQIIYHELKSLQNSNNVIIDYLIISHLDGDHYGNAAAIISDNYIIVKNIVLKHEIYDSSSGNYGLDKENIFKTIATAAANNNTHIITSNDQATKDYLSNTLGTNNYSAITEGQSLNVGKYLKLHFYNTDNIYAGKVCTSGQRVNWTASVSTNKKLTTSDGKYVYFDGSEYPNITFKTTTTPTEKLDQNGNKTTGMNRYFYGYVTENESVCKSNPNSFGILAEVSTTNLSRYLYFAGDLENAGFSTLKSGSNSAQIFENLDLQNGSLTTDITPFTIPSEINAANSIYSKLEKDARTLGLSTNDLLNNIVIYQESHHGINNNEDALWKLNLNRSNNIYSIQEGPLDRLNTTSFAHTKSYFYTLGNIPADKKLRVGVSDKLGVNCDINTNGTTTCAHY